jgi:hypothetical protein
MKTYLSADSAIDESDMVFSISTYNLTDDLRFRQLGILQGGSGTDNVPDSLKADFDDIKVYYTLPPGPSRWIEGKVSIGYPGWEQAKIMAYWQLRSPGLPPTEPVEEGYEWLQIDSNFLGQRLIDFRIGPFSEGTYDFAMKHYNHIADMATSLDLSAGDATGLVFTLWGGDSDGDNVVDEPPEIIPYYGDNDIDFYDYYTLYYQYQASLDIDTGLGSDFDGDGTVGFYDYYSLYYGYQNNPNPGNWYFYP